MSLNITSNSKERSRNQKNLLFSGDKVYLYGDRNYKGILIHAIESTYPQKWTVRLDRGGYEAVNIKQIVVTESRNQGDYLPQKSDRVPEERKILFSDEPSKPKPILTIEETPSHLGQKIKILENTVRELEAQQKFVNQRQRELERENALLKKDLDIAKQVIRRAKNVSPVMRLSLKRVLRLAHHACMDVQRTVGGWILRMGDKARKFRRLADIWDLISVDEFILSEIFPPEKLIAVELIQPPKRRQTAALGDKIARPIMRHGHIKQANQVRPSCPPEDIMRNRTVSPVRSGS